MENIHLKMEIYIKIFPFIRITSLNWVCINVCQKMQMLREKNFKQTIPQVRVEDGEEISFKKADASMRRSIDFWSALQSPHGHWPAENAGVMFYIPPLVYTY